MQIENLRDQISSDFFWEISRLMRSLSKEPSNGFLKASLKPRVKISGPGEVIADDLKIQASPLSTIPTIPEIVALDPSEYAAIDPEKLVGPIFLRHPQNGDRFDPLGLRGRHQKLVDFLRIQGVSHHDKKKTWIMCDQVGVVWVVGHRISDRVKITSASRTALLISARRIGSDR